MPAYASTGSRGGCSLRADARKHAASRTWPEAPYDIIYTVNLFDQLDDEQTAKLIADCRRGLAPGGVLMFGNYSPSMPMPRTRPHRRAHELEHPLPASRRVAPDLRGTWRDAECVRFEAEELQVSQL